MRRLRRPFAPRRQARNEGSLHFYIAYLCEYGETGRRKRLKISRERSRIGSNPITRTTQKGDLKKVAFLRGVG